MVRRGCDFRAKFMKNRLENILSKFVTEKDPFAWAQSPARSVRFVKKKRERQPRSAAPVGETRCGGKALRLKLMRGRFSNATCAVSKRYQRNSLLAAFRCPRAPAA